MNSIENEIIIKPKPESVSWEEITELLHVAYAKNTNKGLEFLAAYQDVDTTIERAKNGICLVALKRDKLIGSISVLFYNKLKGRKKWYNEDKTAAFAQLAVHPDNMGDGIGNKLFDTSIKICEEKGVNSVIITTSVKATKLLQWYKKKGFSFIEFNSYRSTNYYSVKLKKTIKGKQHNKLYIRLRYYISVIICVLLKNKNGEYKTLGKLAKIILK